MPPNSEMILMGNLSNASLTLSTTEFFMHNKRIRGFNLEDHLRDEISEERRHLFFKIVQDDFNHGGKIFNCDVAKQYRFEEYGKAIDEVDKSQ